MLLWFWKESEMGWERECRMIIEWRGALGKQTIVVGEQKGGDMVASGGGWKGQTSGKVNDMQREK